MPTYHRTPWSAFAGLAGLVLQGGDTLEVRRSAVLGRVAGELPAHSTWNGKDLAPASGQASGTNTRWDIPMRSRGGQSQVSFSFAGTEGAVEFRGFRARSEKDSRANEPREKWLLWQLQRCARLSRVSTSGGGADPAEAHLRWGARRTWGSVTNAWKESDGDAAELALIVRLARNHRLQGALREIERAPRRVLLRRHEPVKLSRIQEMDSSSLRVYAQAPGRSPVEKAGARQELLAVVRRDTTKVIENQVVRWVAQRMLRMVREFMAKRSAASSTPHSPYASPEKDVSGLSRLAKRIVQSPQFEEVGDLSHHLTSPTYCLQFEPRYRLVWRAYEMIRRQEQLEDDAWRWQTRLWGTSVRMLLGGMLEHAFGGTADRSMVYVREDGDRGEWLAGPSYPGPFETRAGQCHVIDLRSPMALLGRAWESLPREVFDTGADWVLVWPDARQLLCVWSAVSAPCEDTRTDSDSMELEALDARLASLSRRGPWAWSSLLVVADPDRADGSVTRWTQSDLVTIVRVPSSLPEHWDLFERMIMDTVGGAIHA